MTSRFTAPLTGHHRAAVRRDRLRSRAPALPEPSVPQGGQLPRTPRTRPWWGFCAVAITLFAMMLSATLPTALYATYAHRFGFGPGTLTLIFAAYIAGILAVLVLLGDLADRIGCRAVLLAAVVIAAVGSALFVAADSVAMLFLARFLQGAAVGLALGAGTSALTRLHPNADHSAAALVSTVANVLGQGCGALLGGLLGEWFPDPLRSIWLFYLALLLNAAFLMWRLPEDTVKTGHWLRLSHVSVPAEMRLLFFANAAGAFAMSAVLGLYSSLTPSVLHNLLHLGSLALAGTVSFALFSVSALTQVALRAVKTKTAAISGVAILTAGIITVAVAAALASLILLLLGTVIAGVGQGLAFMSLLASSSSAAPDDRRAEVVSAFYIAAWLGAALPIIGVGFAAPAVGLLPSLYAFTGLITLLAGIAAIILLKLKGQVGDPGLKGAAG
jgi:predicted MFS family arabinose efflux permease